jgi:hypothetical protein
MTMLSKLAWLSAAFSVASFLLFIGLAIERSLALRRMHSQSTPRDPLATGAQAGLVADAGKALEAAAKLTDSLSKAPLVVVALVASLLFLIIGMTAAYFNCDCIKPPKEVESKAPKSASALALGQRCVIRGFADADSKLQTSFDDVPKGCVMQLSEKLHTGHLALLILIGRCDIRELRPLARKVYTDNLSLAYQRAMAVQAFLALTTTDDMTEKDTAISEQTIILAGGAAHLGEKQHHRSNADDRAVDLIPFWFESSG